MDMSLMRMLRAGPDVSFERVADGVADYDGLVLFGALAAVCARLDVFLGVVPRAARIGHHDGQQEAGSDGTDEQSTERLSSENGSDCDGRDDGDQPRQDHLAHSAARADIDGSRVVRLGLALHESVDLTELPADLLYHCARRSSDRLHRERGEEDGIRLPSRTPMSTFTSVRLNTLTPETSEYAAMSASAVSTADPMAKPCR